MPRSGGSKSWALLVQKKYLSRKCPRGTPFDGRGLTPTVAGINRPQEPQREERIEESHGGVKPGRDHLSVVPQHGSNRPEQPCQVRVSSEERDIRAVGRYSGSLGSLDSGIRRCRFRIDNVTAGE